MKFRNPFGGPRCACGQRKNNAGSQSEQASNSNAPPPPPPPAPSPQQSQSPVGSLLPQAPNAPLSLGALGTAQPQPAGGTSAATATGVPAPAPTPAPAPIHQAPAQTSRQSAPHDSSSSTSTVAVRTNQGALLPPALPNVTQNYYFGPWWNPSPGPYPISSPYTASYPTYDYAAPPMYVQPSPVVQVWPIFVQPDGTLSSYYSNSYNYTRRR